MDEELFNNLITSCEEVLAHKKGDLQLKTTTLKIPAKATRKQYDRARTKKVNIELEKSDYARYSNYVEENHFETLTKFFIVTADEYIKNNGNELLCRAKETKRRKQSNSLGQVKRRVAIFIPRN